MATVAKLDAALSTVTAMLEQGTPFEHIEAYIDGAGLPDEEESVLWLYAWCGGHPRELRELVSASEIAPID